MNSWYTLLNKLEKELSPQAVTQWLRPLKIIKFDAGNLYLEAPHPLHISWFNEYAKKYLNKHFLNTRGRPIRVHLFQNTENKVAPSQPSAIEEHDLYQSDCVDPDYTLSNFYTETSQVFIKSLLTKLVEHTLPNPNEYNPIYLYGPSGSGKTHLLMSITNALRKQGFNAFYVHANTFIQQVISAFRWGSISMFRHKYRTIDYLILDDIHDFAKKEATQEELFHTFNYLYQDRIPIVCSSLFAPQSLEGIAHRLISRFEWGITIPLILPSQKIKEVVLRESSKKHGFILSGEILDFLFKSFTHLHDMQQAIAKLGYSLSSKEKMDLHLDTIQKHLSTLIQKTQEKSLNSDQLIELIGNRYAMNKNCLLGKKQTREYAVPRQVSMYYLRKCLNLSYPVIGKIFNKNHSTVMSAIKKVVKEIDTKKEPLYSMIKTIEQDLLKLTKSL